LTAKKAEYTGDDIIKALAEGLTPKELEIWNDQVTLLFLGDRMKKNYKKQANYKDSFEDLYLRHDYLKKITDHDLEGLQKHEKIAKATARIMYNKLRMTYEKVSFYYEDVLNITRVYVAGFLGNYSFNVQPDKLAIFENEFLVRHGRLPDQSEIDRKERNNLINFLRQRLQTCSVFCERKSRNIVVGRGERVFFAYTALTVPASNDAILENPDLFGYRRLTSKEVANLKNKKNLEEEKDHKGFKIISIESHSQMPIPLFVRDFDNNDHVNGDSFSEIVHEKLTQSTEESIIDVEEDIQLSALKEKFNNFSEKQRKQMLSNFIKQNKDNPRLGDEIKAARKLLKVTENWNQVLKDEHPSSRAKTVKSFTDVV
jgi:hypothetical protein